MYSLYGIALSPGHDAFLLGTTIAEKRSAVFYLIYVVGNTLRFGSAIQLLSDIWEYFDSHFITVVVVIFILLFKKISIINSFVRNKVYLLTYLPCFSVLVASAAILLQIELPVTLLLTEAI